MSNPSQSRRIGLRKITIANFKNIGEPVTISLKPITLLFGPNSAGKSTIVQALHYAREILERHNPDPDFTLAGSDNMDMGGFSSLVHKHELDRKIKLGFEIAVSDDGLFPDKDLEAQHKDINGLLLIETIGVQLTTVWQRNIDIPQALIEEYRIIINSQEIAAISALSPNEAYITFINLDHPLFESLEKKEEIKEILQKLYKSHFSLPGYAMGRIERVKLWQDCVVPTFTNHKLELYMNDYFELDKEDFLIFQNFFSLMSQILLRPGKLLLQYLQNMSYLGPLRAIPQRDYIPPHFPDKSRWSNGLAAWDSLIHFYQRNCLGCKNFIEKINEYLSSKDRLNLGYSLRIVGTRQLAEDSLIMANLRILLKEFDEKDIDFFRQRIWEPLSQLPVTYQIQLWDEKNQIEVKPQDIGIGVSQVIPVVIGAMDSGSKIFIVEQPELHVHPAVQCSLGDLFIRESASEEKMFLLETHSEHLILRMLRRIRETNDNELPNDAPSLTPDRLAVMYLENEGNGLKLTELPVDQEGEFTRPWPKGFFEERAQELF